MIKIDFIKKPSTHLIFLAILMLVLFCLSRFQPMDDNFYYLDFSKKLASGQFGFSIPGFHGADFLTAIIYLVSGSEYSVIILDLFFAFACIFMVYLAVAEIFKNKTAAIFAAYLYLLNPLDYTNVLRGGHHTPFIFFTLLGVYLLYKNSKWSWLAMGFSYIIRPFSIALAPLYWQQKKMKQFYFSLIIPAVYVGAEYLQIHRIIIGAHDSLTTGGLFSFQRLILNLGYAFQNYFSIHNFSFLHPLDLADMIHLSPLVTFLAVLAIIYPSRFLFEPRLFKSLVASSALALVIPASFYHLDMWYLWTFNFCLILLALPVIKALPKLVPIIVASFGFQFLYLYLASENSYWLAGNYILFYIFGIIFVTSVIYFLIINKKDENIDCC